MRIHTTDFEAAYVVEARFPLPEHSGSLLRGVLGRALRDVGCAVPSAGCSEACGEPKRCVYGVLFDPIVPSPSPHRFLESGTRAPPRLLPLLSAPKAIPLQAGDVLRFGVRALGAIDDETEARLMRALEQIAELPLGTHGGRVRFESVARKQRRNRVIEVGDAADGEGRLRVALETPVWIEHHGKLARELTFSSLFRAAYRRLTTVCALYGEYTSADEAAFGRLDARTSDVTITSAEIRALRWERLSEEREARHPLHGLVGSIELQGNVELFRPVLNMAAIVHVGKATSFGLGRIQVT